MKPDSEEFDVMSIDLRSLTPQQRDAIVERAGRRARAERTRVHAEMWSRVGAWLRRAASALMSGPKVAAADPVCDQHRA